MLYRPGILASLTCESKSQIAIEYAYRLRKKQQGTSIFWVSASSAARFEQSYRSIAITAKIPGMEDPKSDVLHLVNQWLSGEESGAWLLILDNADDAQLFFGPLATQAGADVESPRLSRYLPQTGTGSILITSRDRSTAFHLTGQNQVLQVGVMSNDDTFALLTNKLPEDPSDKSVKEELIFELDSVPLAITQASAYIRVHAPRMTVAKYLQWLRHGEQDQIQLLSNNEADLRRDPEVPNSVIRTWQMTFSQIRIQRPEAADLLSCMCMLDRQGIPEFLICQDGDQSLKFENAIGVLLQFSLVIEEKGRNMFAIHRLVQLATRTWIETSGQLERFQEDALSLVCQQYPHGGHENWTTCEALEPHAQIVRQYTYDSKCCQLQQADILSKGAHYARNRGRFNDSEKFIQKAIDIRRIYLESEDPKVSVSLGLLAKTYRDLGRWNEAEELATQVLEQQKRVLGVDDPMTLRTLCVLGDTYIAQGRCTEAEKLYKEVQEVTERVLGAESPGMLVMMNNMAVVYDKQARWAEAEKLNLQILEVRRRISGAEHPETLTTMGNLALIYEKQARWTEAEDLILKVLEAQRRVIGAEHPHTLISMSNLALVYNYQKRWTEAEELSMEMLEVQRRVLGAEHPHTLISVSNLALVYDNQKRWTEAEELGVEILEVERRVLGAEHPTTLIMMGNLAAVYENQNRWTEAEELIVETLEVERRVLEAEHPNTLDSMHNLAVFCYHRNRHSEAIERMEEVVELNKKVLGPEHPDTVNSIEWLAHWYHETNRHDESIELMEKVVELRKKVLGPEHPDTIFAVETLAEWKGTQSPT